MLKKTSTYLHLEEMVIKAETEVKQVKIIIVCPYPVESMVFTRRGKLSFFIRV